MKKSFWIPAIVLYGVSIAFSNSVQVGTVLFTTTDLVRKCWTEDDKSVLRARLVMQDLLPDPDCIDFSNPKAAVVLLDYFFACFEIINRFCYGKVQNLMYIALSDALGGYLRAYVLPAAKRGYYAGQIRYCEVEQLYRLYDSIRAFLKTNGKGWAEPQKLPKRNFHVLPLVITGGSYEACKLLRIIEKKGKLHRINPHYGYENSEINTSEVENTEETTTTSNNATDTKSSNETIIRKRSLKGDDEEEFPDKKKTLKSDSEINYLNNREKMFKNLVETTKNETEEEFPDNSDMYEMRKYKCRSATIVSRGNNSTNSTRRVIVPLPMLDDCKNPQSIAVPFKNRPFWNLHSASSAYILEYYYMAVIKCFIAAGNTRTDIKNFNIELHSWLVSQVLPHLNDDKWYPAFGGVLRVVETIKKFGVEPGLNEPSLHDTSYVFGKGVAFEVDDVKEGKDQPRNIAEGACPNTKRHVITAILVVSLLWIFLFCACAFYTQATRGRCGLTEGFSEASCHTREVSRCDCKCAGSKPNKYLNFQFLVKFFKSKRDESRHCREPRPPTDEKVCWYVKKVAAENPFENQSRENKSRDKTSTRRSMKPIDGSKKSTSDPSDFGFFRHEDNFKPILPYWSSQRGRVSPKATHRQELQDKNTTLLWKKPSIKVKKIEKGREDDRKSFKEKNKFAPNRTTSVFYCTSTGDSKSTTTKRYVCSCCSEVCQPISTSGTIPSSQSKVRKMTSSTTMECSEDVQSIRKPFMKSVVTGSTEESECDDEISTSYESDY